MKGKMSSHHVIPSSRSKFGRTVSIPDKFHKAFHAVFGNLYGKECELFLQEVNDLMDEKEEITTRDLARIREEIKGMELYDFQKTKKDSSGRRGRK